MHDYLFNLPLVVWLLIALALTFDFLNGLHDAANSIATIVSTRVLPARYAVFWAAFLNFVAAFVFGSGVAKTVRSMTFDFGLLGRKYSASPRNGRQIGLSIDFTDILHSPALRSLEGSEVDRTRFTSAIRRSP